MTDSMSHHKAPTKANVADSPLGDKVDFVDYYSKEILFPIARDRNQEIDETCPAMFGYDVFQSYEVSWLDVKGKPQIACAKIVVPACSDFMVESKSLKLYLHSINTERYDNWQIVESQIQQDLCELLKADVQVSLLKIDEIHANKSAIEGICLDQLDVEINTFQLDSNLLVINDSDKNSQPTISQTLYTHLLRSRCPVTGQPDWGTVIVQYTGQAIDQEGLLKYLISYRNNQELHEQCVERIYTDLLSVYAPEKLLVCALYMRRGGIDINPVRANYEPVDFELPYMARQ